MLNWHRAKLWIPLTVIAAMFSTVPTRDTAVSETPEMKTAPISSTAILSEAVNAPLQLKDYFAPFSVSGGIDQRLTNSNRPQNETSIVADPNNANTVVGGMNDYSVITTGFAGNGVVYSGDGGATWTHHPTGVALPAGFNRLGGDPSLDFDSQSRLFYGHIAVGFGASNFQANNGVFVSRSNDGGVTWNPTVAVAQNIYSGSGFVNFEDKPYIAADHHPASPFKDRVYLSWTRFYGGAHPAGGLGGGEIMTSYSTNGGATWSIPFRIVVPGNTGTGQIGASFVQGSEPEVASNGDVYVTFWFGGRLEVWRSTNGGVSFAQRTPPFGPFFNVAIVPNPLPNETFRSNPFPNIETDPTRANHVYVVGVDDPADVAGSPDIFFARSTDGGLNWSPRVKLNDDVGTFNQIFPWMAVSKRGAIHVIWYDTRHDPANHDMDVYGAFSIDGGATFCPNFRVTDVTFEPNTGQFGNMFFGDYNGIGAGGQNTFHVLWTDARVGEQEIFYDKLNCEITSLICPPDSTIAGGNIPQFTLSGFEITNASTCSQQFNYSVVTTGPGSLNDLGNPSSLSGTTPLLAPGGMFSPPDAGIDFPFIGSPDSQIVCYKVSPTNNPSWIDSCCTKINVEPALPVAFLAFELVSSSLGIELRWQVVDGRGVEGYNVYRSEDGGRRFNGINAGGLLPGGTSRYLDGGARPGVEYTYRIGAVENGSETLSPPRSASLGFPVARLEQNRPNPFNPLTVITFALPEPQTVELAIYDAHGRPVKSLFIGRGSAGENRVAWDGTNENGERVASGVYYYRLEAGRFSATRKMVFLK